MVVLVGAPSAMLRGEILRKLVSEDPRRSIVKPTQKRTVVEVVFFFFSCADFQTFFLCVEKGRGRGGKEWEGSMEGLKQDSAVK